jgi:hypothetical protein
VLKSCCLGCKYFLCEPTVPIWFPACNFINIFCRAVLVLNSRPHTCYAVTLTPEFFSRPFICVGYFLDRIWWTLCPGWPQNTTLLISISWVARITEVSHWPPAVFILNWYALIPFSLSFLYLKYINHS